MAFGVHRRQSHARRAAPPQPVTSAGSWAGDSGTLLSSITASPLDDGAQSCDATQGLHVSRPPPTSVLRHIPSVRIVVRYVAVGVCTAQTQIRWRVVIWQGTAQARGGPILYLCCC